MDLRSERLRLRDFEEGDWEAMLAIEGDAEAVLQPNAILRLAAGLA